VDLKHITHLHFCLADVAQCLHRAIGAYHTVDTGLAAITPSAPYSALVMQLDVSTLPATTDAGGLGLSMEPAGMMTLMGLRHPALSGMSSLTRVRNTYRTAAMHTAVGALKLLVCCGEVPVKSTSALRAVASTRIAT
jgi:hypothetical protein